MTQSFIRAISKKGKIFDVNYEPGMGIFYTIKEYAGKGLALPKTWQTERRSLNEMYLSFMDPNGEIIVFQFIDWPMIGPTPEIYFVDGPEKRTLRVVHVPELDSMKHLQDTVSPVSDSFWRINNEGMSVEVYNQVGPGECPQREGIMLSDYEEKGSEDQFLDFRTTFVQEYDVQFVKSKWRDETADPEPETIIGLAKDKKNGWKSQAERNMKKLKDRITKRDLNGFHKS